MRVPCFSGRYWLNPEHATYVRDSVPMCHPRTCERHGCSRMSFDYAREAREHLAANEHANEMED